MGRIDFSLESCLELVPDATSAWKPEHAPHATVTKRNGKSMSVMPLRPTAEKPVKASMWSVGCATKIPMKPSAIIA